MRKINKIGLGHVEFIISFVLFTFFVIGLFILLNPFKKAPTNILADTLYLNLEENLTMSFSSLSLSINESSIDGGINCFELNQLPDLNCGNGRNFFAYNSSNDKIRSKLENDKYYFEYNSAQNYYTFHCSEELDYKSDTLANCQNLEEGEYNLGIITHRNMWSEKRITAFEGNYDNNYENVKKRIISGNDFGFIIKEFGEGNNVLFNISNTKPSGINVFAKTLPIDVLKNDGEIIKSTIYLYTW